MRVAIDVSMETKSKGMSIVTENLIRAWIDHDSTHDFTLFAQATGVEAKQYLAARGLSPCGRKDFHLVAWEDRAFRDSCVTWADKHLAQDHPARVFSAKDFENHALCAWASRSPCEIAHHQQYICPQFTVFPRAKHVLTIHDTIGITHPQLCPSRWQEINRYCRAFTEEKASAVITVSEYSKEMILSCYKIDPSIIHVAYWGPRVPPQASFEDDTIVCVRKHLNLPGSFILTTSAIAPHKNIERLLLAWKQILQDPVTRDSTLVIVGDLQFAPGFMDVVRKLEMEHCVRVPGHLPDTEMFALMRAAQAYVCPSLIEGFGLPVLEAMSVGTPVCVSRAASLPEIVGDAGRYFDPYKPEQIAQAIGEALAASAEERAAEGGRAQERSRIFTWQSAASEIAAIYNVI